MKKLPEPVAKMLSEADAVIAEMNFALRSIAVYVPEIKASARELRKQDEAAAREWLNEMGFVI